MDGPIADGGPEFIACPAFLDDDHRCGLPAEVTVNFVLWSTDGQLDAVATVCPRRHRFNAPRDALTFEAAVHSRR